jgi:hypothetical protein
VHRNPQRFATQKSTHRLMRAFFLNARSAFI